MTDAMIDVPTDARTGDVTRRSTLRGPDPDTLPDGGVVVLDVHGVVINNPLPQFLRDVGDRAGIGGDELLRRWRARWRRPFWEGSITEAEMWEAIAPGLDAAELRADLEARYRRGPWFEFVVDHDGPVWLLSNHRTAWLLPRLERFGVADRFERILVSDALRAAKPSPAAFASVAARSDTVYFDDSACNVAAARALGIDAHVVENAGS
jgi:HAD superfamily hydrolase (TIGR01509 family)